MHVSAPRPHANDEGRVHLDTASVNATSRAKTGDLRDAHSATRHRQPFPRGVG